MIINVEKLNKRIQIRDDKAKHVQNYDLDNSYPQNIIKIIQGSTTATTAINLYWKFLRGLGFEDKIFSNQQVDFNKKTIDDLLYYISEDYAKFNGFCLHVSYDLNLDISAINFVPFEYVRLGLEDDLGYIGFACISNNWDRVKKRTLSEQHLTYLDIYNSDKQVIQNQIDRDGGIENYKGQLYYYPTSLNYPLSYIDCILEDCQSDSKIQTFKYKNITTNFMASHILITDKFESQEDERIFWEKIKVFQGADNASKIMWLQKTHPEQNIDLKKLEIADNDNLFSYTETSIQANIRKRFGIPTILFGELIPGKLGATQEIQEATNFYNGMIEGEQQMFSRVFKEIFDNSIFKNNLDNYKISPFRWQI